MFDFSCTYRGKSLTRVTKKVARRLYEQGRTIVLTPWNIRPDSLWGLSIPVHKDDWGSSTFDNTVDKYEIYNCNKDTGLYAAYYV